jgi:hypothetical protein
MSNRGTERHGSPEDSRFAEKSDDQARGNALRAFLLGEQETIVCLDAVFKQRWT